MKSATFSIRPAERGDVPAMLAIYAPIVEQTPISFEVVPPTADEFAARLAKYSKNWAWIVAENGPKLLGYAYGSPHRERAAYAWSVETSVYVSADARGLGVGAALYRDLLGRLAGRGYCNAFAGVALPNRPSEALHVSLGFRKIGVFPRVGRKFDEWHDVAWFHRPLGER